jgi:hypothetical protein
MTGADNDFSEIPPSGKPKPMGTCLLGHPVISPRNGQVDKYKIQAPVRNKRTRFTYSKVLRNQSDTYHDTRTHYLMEQQPSLIQDQVEVMDAAAADKVEALKGRKGPPGPCSSRSGSRYSMSRTCGPRDIISLVIPISGG